VDELKDLDALDEQVSGCRACPRLVAWREEVARTRRAAFASWEYWGRPVPGFGSANAAMLVVGLAPAAHGGNRTGRMFTGDRSGDVLYAALHAVGLASQPTATRLGDGLTLHGVRVTAPVHCAPPANRPTPAERENCRPWLVDELRLLRPTLPGRRPSPHSPPPDGPSPAPARRSPTAPASRWTATGTGPRR
jgi:uracil-DNA glycosylase